MSASGAAALHALEQDLATCLAEVMRIARSAATITRADWQALVEGLTGSPAVLPPATDGANPAEVRAVLLAVQALFDARLVSVERVVLPGASDEVSDAFWTFRHRRLASLVADELAAYIKIAAPRPSVASVFASAARSVAVSAPVRVESERELHRCKTCGAPRHADGLYGNCLYCGRALFNPRQEIE
jgi:hypothetical protein